METRRANMTINKPQDEEKLAEQQYDEAYDYYYQGNWEAAEYHVKEAVDLKPGDPRYRLLLAQTFCALECLSEAAAELRILRNQDPANAGAKSLEMLLKSKIHKRDETLKREAESHSLAGFLKALFKNS